MVCASNAVFTARTAPHRDLKTDNGDGTRAPRLSPILTRHWVAAAMTWWWAVWAGSCWRPGTSSARLASGVFEQLVQWWLVADRLVLEDRGAGASEGTTSWMGRGEMGDYVSFYGFLVYYLSLIHAANSPETEFEAEEEEQRMEILLGGYSYGSMIAAHLPTLETVLSLLAAPAKGSPADGILEQAERLAGLWKGDADSSGERVSVEGAGSGSRQPARPGRRLISVLGERLLISVMSQEVESAAGGDPVSMPVPAVSFLLISPILPPISSVLTMTVGSQLNLDFRTTQGVRVRTSQPRVQLTTHPALAVYGGNDMFTSAGKLRKWCGQLMSVPGSRLRSQEVRDATHFWHSRESMCQLRMAIKDWLAEWGNS